MEKFLEKYFTPDVMMELLEDNHREITAIIEAREKYYLCCDANHVKRKVYL